MTTSLLGYGNTEERRTPDDVSIEREIDVIEAVIQRTNSAVHLIGHSYGGTVCLATALRDQTKIASMTLTEATPFNLLRHSGDLGLYQQVRAMSDAYVCSYHNGKLLAARSITASAVQMCGRISMGQHGDSDRKLKSPSGVDCFLPGSPAP